MEDLAGISLNCTANDVQVASATNIVIMDDGCAFPGDLVTFAATFEVLLTAQARHDVGLYFATDGDEDLNGAISGTCNVSTIPFGDDPPWLDLDGTEDGGFCANDGALACENDRDCRSVGGGCAVRQDLCGDIDSSHSPVFPTIEITTECIDPDGNGKLNLPNCTSWRQPGANGLCLGPEDAFPGAPSKCRCDLGFEVEIEVPAAELTVVKTAGVASVNEPGAAVDFSIELTNQSPFASVDVWSLDDDVFGDVTSVHGAISSTTCSSQVLDPGVTYSCSFTAFVGGLGGTTHTDVVTAWGTDEYGNNVSGSDDASVEIVDLLPSIAVTKTATPTAVVEPGGDVAFAFTIRNTSATDAVVIDTFTDSIYGNLDGRGDCGVPQTIAAGSTYSCSFSTFVSGNAGDVETNVATAEGSDDEGNPVMGSDSASVDIDDSPSSIELIKTASPTSLAEPGGPVTFSFTVHNHSNVDTVSITSLNDSIYGDLHGQGTCSVPQSIDAGGSYSCAMTVGVTGTAFDVHTNVATASGLDDDGNPVSDDDDATVNLTDVAPAAYLTKTPRSAVVTFDVMVRNDSTAESLTLDALSDDVYGDVTQVQGDIVSTTCSVPQTLEPKGEPGESYTCSFEAIVSSSPHTDTVTGTLSDDEGNVIEPSDSAEVTLQ